MTSPVDGTRMPRWRKGRGGFDAPIDHLSADRLGDMVNAERSNPPDLPRLNLPPAAAVMVPESEDVPSAAVALVNGWDESAAPAELPPADPSPVELPPDEPIAAMTVPEALPPDHSSAASSRAVKTAARSKTGRHRRRTSLRFRVWGIRRGVKLRIFTAHTVVLMGIIGLLVVATAVLGVS